MNRIHFWPGNQNKIAIQNRRTAIGKDPEAILFKIEVLSAAKSAIFPQRKIICFVCCNLPGCWLVPFTLEEKSNQTRARQTQWNRKQTLSNWSNPILVWFQIRQRHWIEPAKVKTERKPNNSSSAWHNRNTGETFQVQRRPNWHWHWCDSWKERCDPANHDLESWWRWTRKAPPVSPWCANPEQRWDQGWQNHQNVSCQAFSQLESNLTNSLIDNFSKELELLNGIKSISLSVFDCSYLTALTLKNNHLLKLPPAISKLVNLTKLDVRNNRLRWEILLFCPHNKSWIDPFFPDPCQPNSVTSSSSANFYWTTTISDICHGSWAGCFKLS